MIVAHAFLKQSCPGGYWRLTEIGVCKDAPEDTAKLLADELTGRLGFRAHGDGVYSVRTAYDEYEQWFIGDELPGLWKYYKEKWEKCQTA